MLSSRADLQRPQDGAKVLSQDQRGLCLENPYEREMDLYKRGG